MKMNNLNLSLEDVIKRVEKIRRIRWLGRCLLISIIAILFMCLIDYYFDFTIIHRYIITGIWYSGIIGYFKIDFNHSCKRKVTNAEAAWLIEKSYPELKESLISATEFQNNKNDEFSLKMIETILKKSETYLETFKTKETFPIKWSYVKYPAIVISIFIICAFIPAFEVPLMITRILIPSDKDARPGSYNIELLAPVVNKAPEGENIVFKVRIHKDNIINPIVMIRNHRNRSLAMNYDAKNNFYYAELDKAYGKFEYWINSGRINTQKNIFEVIPRPRIDTFDIEYKYPKYTGISEKKFSSTIGDFKAIEGTLVLVGLNFTKKIQSASINWLDEVYPIELLNNGKKGLFSKRISKNGQYEIVIKDVDGLTSIRKYLFEIKALPDQKPTIEMKEPVGVLYIKKDSKVLVQWNTSDDFGITNQDLILDKNGQMEIIPLPVDKNSYVLNIENLLNLNLGLTLTIQVKDAIGNESKSRTAKLILNKSLDISKAGLYRQHIIKILQQLFDAKKLIEKITEVQSLAIENKEVVGQNYEVENKHLEFQLKDLRIKLENNFSQMQSKINESEDLHYFRHSKDSFRLINLFLSQKITQDIPAVIDYLNSKKEVATLKESIELITDLIFALRLKNMEFLGDVAIANVLNSDLSAMLEIGKSYQSSFSQNDSFKGLIFYGFLGLNRFLTPPEILTKSPDKLTILNQLNFSNFNNYGFGQNPIFYGKAEGFLKIEKFQDINIHLISDDGSRLFIDDKLVINNEGNHGPVEVTGLIKMEPGLHKIMIEYFNFSDAGTLQLMWSGVELPKAIIPSDNFLWLNAKDGQNPEILRKILNTELVLKMEDFNGVINAKQKIQNCIGNDGLAFKNALIDLEEERTKGKEAVVNKVIEKVLKNVENINDNNKDLFAELIKTIKEAKENNDIDTLKKASELLSLIDKAEALEKFRSKLDEFQKDQKSNRDLIDKNISQLNPEKNIARVSEKKSEFQALKDELKNSLINDKAVKALSELVTSDNHWKQAEKNLLLPDTTIAKKEMENSDVQLEAAKKSVDDSLKEWGEKKEKLIDEIKGLHDDSNEKLAKVIQDIKEHPKNFEQDKNALKEIKDDLIKNAESQLLKNDGDIQDAKQDMILAKKIDQILIKDSKEAPQANLDELNDLNNKFQNNSNEVLNPEEKKQVGKEIDDKLKAEFGDDILKKLKDYSDLKEIEDDVNLMAKNSKGLEVTPDINKGMELFKETDEIKDRINEQLTPEQMQTKGKALINEAIKNIDEIEKAIDSKDNQQVAKLDDAKKAFEKEMKEISSLRDQAGKMRSPIKSKYEQATKPVLDEMVKQKNLTGEPKNIENIKKNLDDLKNSLNDSKNDFNELTKLSQNEIKPIDDAMRDALVAPVMELEKAMLNTQSAIEGIQKAQEKIDDNNLKVRKELRKMPRGNLSEEKNKQVEEFKRIAPQLSNQKLAEGLTNLAQQLQREDPQLKNELTKLAETIQKDNNLENQKNNQFAAQKNTNKLAAEQLANQIENALKNKQALTENSEKALEKLKENVKKDDLETAFKNLNNLKNQIAQKPVEEVSEQSIAEKVNNAEKLLKEASELGDANQKKNIAKALEDLQKGDYEKASQEAKAIADQKANEVKAADQFAKALQKKVNDLNRLKRANELAKVDRLNEAANEIDKTEDNQALSKEIQKAMEAKLNALQDLQKEIAEQHGEKNAEELAAALYKAKNGQFKKANEAIQANTKTPQEVKDSFAKAQKESERVLKDLDKQIADIEKDNSNTSKGVEAVKDLQKQNEENIAKANKEIKQLEEDTANLQKALQLAQNEDWKNAKKAIEKNDQKNSQNKALDEALDKVVEAQNNGKELAKQAAASEKDAAVKGQLEEAAKPNKNIAQEQANAQAAGKAGEPAMKAFQEADKNKKSLEGDLAKAMNDQQKQIAELKNNLNKINSDQQQLKNAETYANNKDLNNAKQVMDQMAKGQQQAAKANQLLDQVAKALDSQQQKNDTPNSDQKQNSKQNKEPTQPDANNPLASDEQNNETQDSSDNPAPTSQKDDLMAKALDQLSKASEGLEDGKPDSQTTKAFQDAAKSLGQIKNNQEKSIMAGLPKSEVQKEQSDKSQKQKSQGKQSKGKSQESQDSDNNTADKGKSSDDKSNEESNKSDSKNKSETSQSKDGSGKKEQGTSFKEKQGDLDVVSSKNTWDGVKDNLKNKANESSSSTYSDYYKNANQKYLQKILQESQKWKEE